MVHELLFRLNGVRQINGSRWKAHCPSHHDRNPSLHITLADDGTTLWHCKVGCDQYEVISAVGLPFSDFFSKREGYSKATKNSFPATDVLRCVQEEVWNIIIAALTKTNGIKTLME